jgi:hypothetical protein
VTLRGVLAGPFHGPSVGVWGLSVNVLVTSAEPIEETPPVSERAQPDIQLPTFDELPFDVAVALSTPDHCIRDANQ